MTTDHHHGTPPAPVERRAVALEELVSARSAIVCSPEACSFTRCACWRAVSLGCLPFSFPFALATAIPSRVPSRGRSTSNSAKVARS
jgi:hypothetical protein